MISVIIRTKNEERWIRPCLEGVMSQRVDLPVEMVLVDNQSTDRTVDRARKICPDIKLVEIEDFLPGLALNLGIRASSGDYIVCLSAHCPPVSDQWLSALLRNLDDPEVAGVYGRQVPTRFTSSVDKRDLFLTFGLDRRVQVRDTFFHNANSMLRREVWNEYPFDEDISNIEDRLWGKQVIQAGYKIVYEPDAAVFHHHGIHQDNRPDRAKSVVRILEANMPEVHSEQFGDPFDPERQEITAIVPLRATGSDLDFNRKLIERTINAAIESSYVKRILVTTESEELASIAESLGAEVPFLRPKELTDPDVRVDEVLRHFLERLEEDNYLPDIVVPLEISYPFRPPGLLDNLIEHLVKNGVDTVIAGLSEYRPCWRNSDGEFHALSDLSQPRHKRNPIHIGLPSLGCATYPANLRSGTRLSGKVGVFEVTDPLAGIEIRSLEQLKALEERLNPGEWS